MKSFLLNYWISSLTRKKSLLPTLLFIPILYLLGWFAVQPLSLFGDYFSRDKLSLYGTIVSFLSFLLLLPDWVRLRWGNKSPFKALGLTPSIENAIGKTFLLGFAWSLGLLSLVLLIAFWGSWALWIGEVKGEVIVNALLLCLGVGFAEELIFRGWLWGELNQILGYTSGIFAQAIIFSVVHLRFDQGLLPMLLLLVGLFLLGLVLAIRRKLDRGSLWGCIGFHGGLVGGWFLLNSGLIQFSPNAPDWLVGPGEFAPNPIAGFLAITALSFKLWFYRKAFPIDALP